MASIFAGNTTEILIVGVIATAALDLWALVLNRTAGQPLTNWGHVGRWVAGMPHGKFCYADIAAAPESSGERAIGWSTHYVVGMAYALGYFVVLAAMSREPGIFSAAAFGLVTVLAPWLILQPSLGAGLFAAHTPNPRMTRLRNLLSHLVFGSALYLGWQLVAFFG
ncbi:MAG TPA: DUF2938 family protein [Gammaproteobacteria bacterium]|nr:DUF2938 family protein [Gammaproteobacteria bacterium]